MSSFTEDIYYEILLRVPEKSLIAFKCVCKTWLSLITGPNFTKMHLNHSIQRKKPSLLLRVTDFTRADYWNLFYTIDHDSLESLLSTNLVLEFAVQIDCPFKSSRCAELMACCDGLVCLWYGGSGIFCLWNPATREYKELPKSNITEHVCMVGFGYDSKGDDYKILAGTESLFQVYSLGSNSWRTPETVSNKFYSSEPSGVLVNGHLHWLVKNLDSNSDDSVKEILVSFDISNEIFEQVELQNIEYWENGCRFDSIGVLEGCLCLFAVNPGVRVDVWMMRNYGVPESWTKRYVMKDEAIVNAHVRLMWSFRSGEILFGGVPKLVLYNPEYDTAIEPYIPSSTSLSRKACYTESLVSVKSGTYLLAEKEQTEESDSDTYSDI